MYNHPSSHHPLQASLRDEYLETAKQKLQLFSNYLGEKQWFVGSEVSRLIIGWFEMRAPWRYLVCCLLASYRSLMWILYSTMYSSSIEHSKQPCLKALRISRYEMIIDCDEKLLQDHVQVHLCMLQAFMDKIEVCEPGYPIVAMWALWQQMWLTLWKWDLH